MRRPSASGLAPASGPETARSFGFHRGSASYVGCLTPRQPQRPRSWPCWPQRRRKRLPRSAQAPRFTSTMDGGKAEGQRETKSPEASSIDATSE